MNRAAVVPEGNRLLTALPSAAWRRLSGSLEAVPLKTQDILYHLAQPIEHVYFPSRGCLISLFGDPGDGRSIRAGLVGDDGMVGVEVFLGGRTAQYTATVLAAGDALRMEAEAFGAAVRDGGPLAALLRRYVQYLLLHFSQVAVCNRFHSLEQHFSSFLLLMQSLCGRDDLQITHEGFARMIGVRRVGITQVARKLQRAGLIRYRWGKVAIIDRPGLEAHACVCHRQIEQVYRDVFRLVTW